MEDERIDATRRLASMIEEALVLCDELGELDVGIRLDAALVALTGKGLPIGRLSEELVPNQR